MLITLGCSSSIQRSPSSFIGKSCKKLIHNIFFSKNKEITLKEGRFTSLGIETEGSIPEDLTYEDLGLMIKSEFLKRNPEIEINVKKSGSQTTVNYEIDGYEYTWTVKADGSLKFSDGLTGVEITTPVIRNFRDLSDNLFLLSRLKSMGMKADPSQAGIHIHYGLPDNLKISTLLKIVKNFKKLDSALKSTFHTSPTRGYLDIQNLDNYIVKLEKLVASNPDATITDEASRNIGGTRSIVRVVKRIQTFEVRLFNSNLEDDVYKVTTDFTYRFMNKLVEEDPKLYSYLESTPQNKLSIKEISKIVESELHENINVLRKLEYELLDFLDTAKKLEKEYDPKPPRVLRITWLKGQLRKIGNDNQLAILTDRIQQFSTKDLIKSVNLIKKSDKLGENTLISLSQVLGRTDLKEQQRILIAKALIELTDGSAINDIFRNLKSNLEVTSLFHTELSKSEIGDYKLAKFIEALTDRKIPSPLISRELNTIMTMELGEFTKKKLIIYFMDQGLNSSHREYIKELVLLDSAFTPRDSQKLSSIILNQNESDYESFGKNVLEFMLKQSKYKKTHSLSYLNSILEVEGIQISDQVENILRSLNKEARSGTFNSVLDILNKFKDDLTPVELSNISQNLIKSINSTAKQNNQVSSALALRIARFFKGRQNLIPRMDLVLDMLTTQLKSEFNYDLFNEIVLLTKNWTHGLEPDKLKELIERQVSIIGGINKYKFAAKQNEIHETLNFLKENANGDRELIEKIQTQLNRDEKSRIREQLERRRAAN